MFTRKKRGERTFIPVTPSFHTNKYHLSESLDSVRLVKVSLYDQAVSDPDNYRDVTKDGLATDSLIFDVVNSF
jgi:hypothetical protein